MIGRQLLRRPGYDIDIEMVLAACADHGPPKSSSLGRSQVMGSAFVAFTNAALPKTKSDEM